MEETSTPGKEEWGESANWEGVALGKDREGREGKRKGETDERGKDKSDVEKQKATPSEGISHLKVPMGPGAGSHLLRTAPGSEQPPGRSAKLGAPGPISTVPLHLDLGRGKARSKDEPRDPGPRRSGLPALETSLAAAVAPAAAAARGGGASRLRD